MERWARRSQLRSFLRALDAYVLLVADLLARPLARACDGRRDKAAEHAAERNDRRLARVGKGRDDRKEPRADDRDEDPERVVAHRAHGLRVRRGRAAGGQPHVGRLRGLGAVLHGQAARRQAGELVVVDADALGVAQPAGHVDGLRRASSAARSGWS